jgi:hypothetical protein
MSSSGLIGRRRTYLTILKKAWSANLQNGMVSPSASSEAGARRPAIIQLEQFKEHIMLRDLLTQIAWNKKTITDLVCPRACGFRKYQFENRSWEGFLLTFFKNWFLLHKLLLKLEKWPKIQIFGFFFKSLIFEFNHSKTVHDLKNVKIAEKSLKIGQLLPILANFSQF